MYNDTPDEGKDSNSNGIYVILPAGCALKKSVQALSQRLSGSLGAKERSVEDTVERYVIGETYFGHNEAKIKVKINELEPKIVKMINRHNENHPTTCTDVTAVVGSAILSVSCGPKSRKDAMEARKKQSLGHLNVTLTPNMWRLVEARRFFLVVLSLDESPITAVTRDTHALIEGISLGQEDTKATLEWIQESLEGLLNRISSATSSKPRKYSSLVSRKDALLQLHRLATSIPVYGRYSWIRDDYQQASPCHENIG